jgi:hypothetical protein
MSNSSKEKDYWFDFAPQKENSFQRKDEQTRLKYELKEDYRIVKQKIENSPVTGMVIYGAGAVGMFVLLILLVFVLIVFLKR